VCRTTKNIPEFKVEPQIALELLMAANFLGKDACVKLFAAGAWSLSYTHLVGFLGQFLFGQQWTAVYAGWLRNQIYIGD